MSRRFSLPTMLVLAFVLLFPFCYVHAQSGVSPQKDDKPIPRAGKDGYTNPRCSYCPDPEYSKEAHEQKIQGRVVLDVVIGPDGRAHQIKIVRYVGHGLDEEAIKAARDVWRFKPALGPDGKPATVRMLIEVNFHLY